MEKAYWVNHQYLKSVDPKRVAPEFKWHLQRIGIDVDALGADAPALDAVIAAQAERCKTLVEMAGKSRFFFAPLQGYVEKDATKHLTPETAPVLDELRTALAALTEWTAPALHAAVAAFCEARGLSLGKVAQPVRVAVAGMAISPPIDQTLALLGRETTLARLAAAVAYDAARVGGG
jgi:glutamyl-tRNA synthetase